MEHPIDVALANDFELVVVGLARLLAPFEHRVRVCDVVVRGEPIGEPVDVVLFDVFAHPDLGFADIGPLVADDTITHVAVFTWQLDDATVERGWELGVSGYLGKNLSALELVDGLERVAAGERVVTGHPGADHRTTGRDWPGRAEGLSERESEVLVLIAEGCTNSEIATALHLSINSVKTHVRSAYRKLAVERRSQAVRKVMDLGLAHRAVDRARLEHTPIVVVGPATPTPHHGRAPVAMSDPTDRRVGDEMLVALQRVTDASLTRLDVDEMLVELLARIQDILEADTAAVLLLDESTGHLVARAARGIEEEVRQGVRVPVGTGFAGQIAATLQPRRLERVDASTVANPILWEKGIRVMLGVPLVTAGRLLGVLHVGRLDDRPFTDEDALLLQVVGDRVAATTQARQLEVERAAAVMLERSLVPSALPSCDGLEFATRYIPTERHMVGGDWYDLFTLPSGALWMVVGDVAGHGLQAAVVMGRIRSAMRAYAMLDLPPHEVLELVDRKVDHFEIDTIATVACVVTSPPFDCAEVALAGHAPPILAVPGAPTVALPALGDPPLGTATTRRRRGMTLALPPGCVLALYTDGLFERRGESILDGIARLCGTITPDQPEAVARTVMSRMVGTTTPEDDIALVVARRTS